MESLLKIKISLEKQLKSKLAEANEKLESCIKALTELEEKKCSVKRAFACKLNCTNAYDLKIYNQYYGDVERKRLAQVMVVREAERELSDIQKQLIDVIAEKKMFEKLKEKQFQAYLLEQRIEQDKEIDDLLSYKIAKV
jgi:flagellar FliJ protein